MRKTISKVCFLILIIQMLLSHLEGWAANPTITSKLKEANDEIKTMWNLDKDDPKILNYYGLKGYYNRPLNEGLVANGWIGKEYPAFVYGTAAAASEAANAGADKKGSEYRCIGYAVEGDLFTNPDFPDDYPLSGDADRKNFVEAPWTKKKDIDLIDRLMSKGLGDFDMNKMTTLAQKPDYYRRSIAMGVGLQYGVFYNQSLKAQSDADIAKALLQLSKGYTKNRVCGKYLTIPWEKYCHIIQPPTQKSWGTGWVVHESGNSYYYFTVLLPPLELTIPADDLSVSPVSVPKSVSEGLQAEVIFKVDSTYKTNQDTPYKWEVIDSQTGEPVPGAVYSGIANTDQGRLNLAPNVELTDGQGSGEPLPEDVQQVKVNFTMPSHDVVVRFRVNNLKGDDPKETNLINNTYSTTILKKKVLVATEGYNLGFNVLSKEIEHALAKGNAQNASVSLPEGDWTGPLTGQLNIAKEDPKGFLERYQIKATTNEPVNEDSESVSRSPVVQSTVFRHTFTDGSGHNDDPEHGEFVNLSNPWSPLKGVANLRYEGTVKRPWRYEWTEYCGSENCSGHKRVRTGVESDDFGNVLNTVLDTLNMNAYTYNGQDPDNMPAVAARDFKRVVENNGENLDKRNLFWISDPYHLDVLRWMVNEKLIPEDNTYQTVNGQYQRIFTQQDTGSIEFDVKNSMASIYDRDRSAARRGSRKKGDYLNVVFPTDRDLQTKDYPIKSGYYLTPRGVYTVTLITSLYKDTDTNTKEHAELVQKLIDAFHYKSDMTFTLKGSDGYLLDLTAENNVIEGKHMLKVEKDTDKKVEELNHTENSAYAVNDSRNDKRIRQILEGYEDSNTEDSLTNFKYREYLKDRNRLNKEQHLYKVDETTLITFTVNPNDKKLYTYVNMMDSDRRGSEYSIRTWFEDMPLNRYGYNGLSITGRPNSDRTALDALNLYVKGSLYDDVNN